MQALHINGIRVGDNNLEKHKKGISLYPTFLQHCMDYNLSEYDQHNLSTHSCLLCKLERFFNHLNLTVAVKNVSKTYIVVHASVIQEFGKCRQGGQKFKIILGSLANSGYSGPCQILSKFF